MPAAVGFPSLVAVSVVLVLSPCATAAADGGVPLGVPSAAEFSPDRWQQTGRLGWGCWLSVTPCWCARVASDAAAVPGSGEPSPVTPWFPAAGNYDCSCAADCGFVTPEVAGSPGSADFGKFIGPVGAGGVAGGDGGAPHGWFNLLLYLHLLSIDPSHFPPNRGPASQQNPRHSLHHFLPLPDQQLIEHSALPTRHFPL
ncbi:hypothetical protein TcYC6_0020870 [Trypanosoma cruzi]|nr:hypothetical protein TcYC6_0020870 [Trypanosoma cruzi]